MSALPPRDLCALSDILEAWQRGEIGYRRAMSLAGIDSLLELYEAARVSRVPIRLILTEAELVQAEMVTQALREAGWP
jgi:hypothetical protein